MKLKHCFTSHLKFMDPSHVPYDIYIYMSIVLSETSERKRRFHEANNPHGWEIAEPYGKSMACPLVSKFVGRFIQSFCLSLFFSFSVGNNVYFSKEQCHVIYILKDKPFQIKSKKRVMQIEST